MPSPGTISSGTRVNSYLIHYDTVGTPSTLVSLSGSVTFDQEILGVIFRSETLDATDVLLGLPTTSYPTGQINRRSFVFDEFEDTISLSSDRRTLSMTLATNFSIDQLRVVTAVPEPSGIVLLATGCLMVLGCTRYIRRVDRPLP